MNATPPQAKATDPICKKCSVELTDENWYPSHQKKNEYICKGCSNVRGRKSSIRSERRKGVQPFNENRRCGMYLGVHIAERVLSHVFKNVERMPINNPGYDVICNHKKKIDIKSSCQRGGGGWSFGIRNNIIADYFLCLAFDNREDLNPLHVWLIPGCKISHLKGLSINQGTINKWDEYALDISKTSECCDTMRRTARITTPPTPPTPPPFEQNSPRLRVLSYLRAGLRPAKIAAKMGITMSTIQYHLSILKKQGLIHKAGYGCWEVLREPTIEELTPRGLSRVSTPHLPPHRGSSNRSTAVLSQSELTRFTQDSVRAHAFVFTLQVPRNLRNWNNKRRVKFLETNSIPYKPLKIGGGGQRIIVKDKKTWLLDKSIIIYDKASYFAEAALDAKITAIAKHISIIKHVERLLHTSFLIGSDYKFKVSRQHYALIYNALAKQYNEAGEKLEIRTTKGAWLLIDNSYNMQELETIHPKTAMTDNGKVLSFFNSLKDHPLTTDFIFEAMTGIQKSQQTITENQMLYADNIGSHITAIRTLGSGIQTMNELLEKFAGSQK